ncbi:antitoxin Xre/MbcA/ParS toxin-binding domain-containing protein [Thalassorhabdomicrobium marinisediminis]|uniref:antitoxin Xre/MbcA/ParS toxin-binding domain-containing protein n=1 Tax=Thalassorhabdomicrobium marinisediminis TaxID=2170577 RepID=UPI003BAE6475
MFFSKPMARDWLTKPNDGPLFGGLRPVDAALAGGLPMIVQIRDHVDALLQGN